MIKKNKKQKNNQICNSSINSEDIIFNLSNATLEFITKTIGRKWSFQIILELKKHGTLRNKDLAKTLNGISPSTLSRFLKDLQKQKMIRREMYGEIPPVQVDYSLTAYGKDLFNYLLPLFQYVSSFQQIRCAVCDCTPNDCKDSKSPQDCSYCKFDQCCCWDYFHKK